MLSTAQRRRTTRDKIRHDAGRKRLKVAVLMGGVGHERAVSLVSGREIAAALRSAGHLVVPWELTTTDPRQLDGLEMGFDVAFLGLHGEYGEDGTIQQALAERGICYTGSGPEASARAFDKIRAKRLLGRAGVPLAAHGTLEFPFSARGIRHAVRMTGDGPWVVKPVRMGSSVGVSLCRNRGQVRRALEQGAIYRQHQLIEEFVPGHELTCGVLADRPLPVVEAIAQRTFFDYEAKYEKSTGTEYVVEPTTIPESVRAEIRRLALESHRALGCDDYSRTDFRYDPGSGKLVVLEVNTLPGMTKTSLLPKAAGAAGISFVELLTRICSLAMRVTV